MSENRDQQVFTEQSMPDDYVDPETQFDPDEAVVIIKKFARRKARHLVVLAVLGVGVYCGVKRPFKAISKDVAKIDGTLGEISRFLAARADYTDALVSADRQAIREAIETGRDFTHYPGLGVLLRPVEEAAKKKAS